MTRERNGGWFNDGTKEGEPYLFDPKNPTD